MNSSDEEAVKDSFSFGTVGCQSLLARAVEPSSDEDINSTISHSPSKKSTDHDSIIPTEYFHDIKDKQVDMTDLHWMVHILNFAKISVLFSLRILELFLPIFVHPQAKRVEESENHPRLTVNTPPTAAQCKDILDKRDPNRQPLSESNSHRFNKINKKVTVIQTSGALIIL